MMSAMGVIEMQTQSNGPKLPTVCSAGLILKAATNRTTNSDPTAVQGKKSNGVKRGNGRLTRAGMSFVGLGNAITHRAEILVRNLLECIYYPKAVGGALLGACATVSLLLEAMFRAAAQSRRY